MAPPGSIIVTTTSEQARWHDFTFSLAMLERPLGTALIFQSGYLVADNLNVCIRGMRGDWVAKIDDDHKFDRDTLVRLLDRMYEQDLDVVAPLCLARPWPFVPVAFKRVEHGYVSIDLDAYEQDSVVECDSLGGGFIVIRKRVLDAIGDPWFKADSSIGKWHVPEDQIFCNEVLDRGFRLWVDLAVQIGHVASVVLEPASADGESGVSVSFGNKAMFIPRAAFAPDASV